MSAFPYDLLMNFFKDYNDIMNRLYTLHVSKEDEINTFYEDFINKLYKYTDKYELSYIFETVSMAAKGNNRFIKSYLILMQKILEKLCPDKIKGVPSVGQYILKNYFGITITNSFQSQK